MSKLVMQAHFRHLCFNNFPMIWIILQTNGFWPLKSLFENSGVHLGFQLPQWEFIWECEGSFLHTLCIPKSMWGDFRPPFWLATLQPPLPWSRAQGYDCENKILSVHNFENYCVNFDYWNVRKVVVYYFYIQCKFAIPWFFGDLMMIDFL
jgi:hypothetical protein